MTGLKSGSGDDLWGEDTNEDGTTEDDRTAADEQSVSAANDPVTSSSKPSAELTGEDEKSTDEPVERKQPYIVRRAIQDKSVQFERDERLTFFVHDDVVDGERKLLMEIEAAFGRDVPKFDVREAVYRAALENRDDVLTELINMGYSTKD